MCLIFPVAELILSSHFVQHSSSLCNFAAYLQGIRLYISRPEDGTFTLWKILSYVLLKIHPFYLPMGNPDVFSFLYAHNVIYGTTLPSR